MCVKLYTYIYTYAYTHNTKSCILNLFKNVIGVHQQDQVILRTEFVRTLLYIISIMSQTRTHEHTHIHTDTHLYIYIYIYIYTYRYIYIYIYVNSGTAVGCRNVSIKFIIYLYSTSINF